MAHQDVAARPLELVRSRRSAHPLRTVASPTAHSGSPLLIQCSGAAPSGPPASLILVALGGSCQLDIVKSRRRTPAGWRGAGAGSLGCRTGSRDDTMPSHPIVAYKAWSACPRAFCFFLPTCLPCPRRCFANHLAVRLRCSQQDRAALFDFRVTLLFPSESIQSCPPSLLRLGCSLCRQQCPRRSLQRISSSELVQRVPGSTRRFSMALKFRNTSHPRLRRITRVPWVCGTGDSPALGLVRLFKESHFPDPHPTSNRYTQDHPGADPYDLETLKDFVREICVRD